jgi:hypothetical protein
MFGIDNNSGRWGTTGRLATRKPALAGTVLPALLLLGLLSGCGFASSRLAFGGRAEPALAGSVWHVKCYPAGYPVGGFAPIQGVIQFYPDGRYEYKQDSPWFGQGGKFETVELSESGTYEYDAARGELTMRGPGGVVTGPIPYHGEARTQGPGPYGSVLICERIYP